jgi:triosephosphate isomerase
MPKVGYMRRALIVANWKMHGTRSSIRELLSGLVPELASGINGVDVVVCPPFPYLSMVSRQIQGAEIILGAQNVWVESAGAFTGEVAPGMLVDCKVRFVITGHSERRQLMAESDDLIARKFAAIQQHRLIPILCVGETMAQRDAGDAEAVVAAQLHATISVSGIAAMERAVIAYEPVWAIGTGRSATAEQAQLMHAFIRGIIARHDAEVAETVQILYGGSVNADNAEQLFAQPDIDGGLVGGASLDAKAFIQICHSVS